MAKTDFDFTKAAEEFLASMKIDTSAFDGAAKNAAEFNTKLAKIALDAAKKNAKLTGDWTAETLKKIETNADAKTDPADFANVANAFSSEQAQAMQAKIAEFAEVAKTAQEKTVELFVSASKDLQSEVAKAAKKQ
ncbi:MAG: phasin, PhaP [Rhodobacteraceae bacterium]|nr:phasin, PhaP [Paracoccaceae bacterium]